MSYVLQPVQAASTTVSGISRLTTTAEVQAGSDATLAITPAAMKAALGFSKFFESSEAVITAGTVSAQAHGLGAIPKLGFIGMRCKTAEFGYSIGDEIYVAAYGLIVNNNAGASVVGDATNVTMMALAGGAPIEIINKSSGAGQNATVANWRMFCRVWG